MSVSIEEEQQLHRGAGTNWLELDASDTSGTRRTWWKRLVEKGEVAGHVHDAASAGPAHRPPTRAE